MKKTLFFASVVSILNFGLHPALAIPEFVNGSFEEPQALLGGLIIAYTGAPIPGWRVVGGSIELISKDYWQPAAGNQSIDTVGVLVRGSIEQDLTFDATAEFYLSFQLSRNPRVQPPIQLGVWYKPPSSTQFLGLGVFEYDDPTSNADMRWRTLDTASFTAEAGLTTFAFASLTGGGSSNTDTWGGTALDNIVLVSGASPFTPGQPPSYIVPPFLQPPGHPLLEYYGGYGTPPPGPIIPPPPGPGNPPPPGPVVNPVPDMGSTSSLMFVALVALKTYQVRVRR